MVSERFQVEVLKWMSDEKKMNKYVDVFASKTHIDIGKNTSNQSNIQHEKNKARKREGEGE